MIGTRRSGTVIAVFVGGSALLAALAVLLPVPAAARALAVLVFTAAAPGAAIAGLLRIRDLAAFAMVTVAASLTVNLLVSEAAVLARRWEPDALLLGLAAVCTGAALCVHRNGEKPS